jgi:hypothetical protein
MEGREGVPCPNFSLGFWALWGGKIKQQTTIWSLSKVFGCWLKRKTLQHLWVLQRRDTKLLDPKPYSSSFRVGPPGIAHEVPMKRSMYPQTMNETSFVSH